MASYATPTYGYFGSNLTDLQSGINKAKEIDAMRLAAEQQARSERLASFGQMMSANQRNRMQQESANRDRTFDYAQLGQNNKQTEREFGIRENELTVERAWRQQQEAIRNAQIEASTTLAREGLTNDFNIAKLRSNEISPAMARWKQEMEQEQIAQQQAEGYAQQLSTARQKAVEEMKELNAKQVWYDSGDPNKSWFNPTVNPRFTELKETLAKLDTLATGLKLAPDPTTLGYAGYAPTMVPPPTPQNPGYQPNTNVLPNSVTNRYRLLPDGVSIAPIR